VIVHRSRDEVLDVLLETFRREGYDGASLASLSKATGLGKSSLYYWFPGGKEDMASQVLDRVDAWMTRELLEPLAEGEPQQRIDRLLDVLVGFYANGEEACILGRLCASVERHRFQPRLEALFGRWIGGLADALVAGGVPPRVARERAEDAVIGIQGALVLAAGLDDPAPFRRVVARLRRELLSTSGSA
jgi:AcrR family transcriptional regulator